MGVKLVTRSIVYSGDFFFRDFCTKFGKLLILGWKNLIEKLFNR